MSELISRYRTFLAVAEAGSITEAARRLFVSQPAVSAEIAALESALGVHLFVRTNRGVRLTDEGQVLYTHAQKSFAILDAGEERLREIAGLQSGKLRIGASDMTLRFFLLDHIAAFRAAYPAVRLSVTNAPTPRTLDALRDGTIDFGAVSGPLPPDAEEEFDLFPVRDVQDIFIAAPDHPLAKKRQIPLSELREFPLMMLEGPTSTRRYIDAFLGRDFPPPAVELATSDLLLEFAAHGFGICPIVADFAEAALTAGRVVRLSLEKEPEPRRFFIVSSRRTAPSAAAGRMISMIREASHVH